MGQYGYGLKHGYSGFLVPKNEAIHLKDWKRPIEEFPFPGTESGSIPLEWSHGVCLKMGDPQNQPKVIKPEGHNNDDRSISFTTQA